MTQLNHTHDPSLASWVSSANATGSDFPIQNLPFAVFRRAGSAEAYRGGVAIGDQVIDLAVLADLDLYQGDELVVVAAAAEHTLNTFMGLGPRYWRALRAALSRDLRSGAAAESALRLALVPQAEVEYALPARIGDYTDFYTSIHHATAVGRQFRPDNPLLPNYRWVPIGYHGRSSSIGVSGQSFPRPQGQLKALAATAPRLGAAQRMDYELEVGIFIGPGNRLGSPISMDQAESHVFGLCLLNDWSARDIQGWEYQPLGPFLAKNFASTISPWIVTLEALAPYRVPWERDAEEPQPLPYLDSPENRAAGGVDLQLEVALSTQAMQAAGMPPVTLARSNFAWSYWTVAQLVAHHSVNGCNLTPGDLFGSGTQSGPEPAQAGSLLELSNGGQNPIDLGNGESRTFLEDGDTVIMRGHCEAPGRARVGFGAVQATLLPQA
jgi:fumarylacetoacetase